MHQKKVNIILLSNMNIRKIAHINSSLAFIPIFEINLKQLKKNASRLAQIYKTCQVKKNKKCTKYLI